MYGRPITMLADETREGTPSERSVKQVKSLMRNCEERDEQQVFCDDTCGGVVSLSLIFKVSGNMSVRVTTVLSNKITKKGHTISCVYNLDRQETSVEMSIH